ncbi:hypothetical protein AGLY_012054 [Aphis glycines]|uniref:RING-type domain-containing protein n=1 Tax=Aphis glycines TaxID=307491 RepID=A0A6G0T916_APHGL|nr:hypothetical protein AGLY_012054 [Aphis glycines]
MKLFRRSKHCDDDDDDDDSAWFRDDLQRIRQAYREQEPDYAAVTPTADRRRPAAAATWSRWSGSTTTVYSFAYVDGAPRDDDERTRRDGRRADGDDDDDDVVEYIDAATLPVAHRRRTDRERSQTPSAGTSGRANQTTGTTTATRRRNKRIAPPPPAQIETAAAAAAAPTTVQRRAAGTISRKKYRAPQPPAPPANGSSESRPQQQRGQQACRRTAPARRRRKGPAPKPPVVQQQRQQQQQQQPPRPPPPPPPPVAAVEAGSNVKRKISQYERDRLMERVDKIEKHFFDKTAAAPKAETAAAAARRHGFASPAALYTAMAATNLTELDKRAAEICRQRNQRGAAPLTADHKNAIVSAVIRKSYPTATAADGVGRPDRLQLQRPTTSAAAADDEKRLVRHKRLAFFPATAADGIRGRAAGDPHRRQKRGDGRRRRGPRHAVAPNDADRVGRRGGEKVRSRRDTCDRRGLNFICYFSDTKNLTSEDKDNNCYQQLMAMEMQSDLVLHNGPFECAVCLCTYDNNGVVLRDCLHVFCRLCLQMTIDHSKAEQVECPYIDDRYSCTGVLQHREIKKILDSDEKYERFLQRSVERARQLLAKEHNGGSFQCRRPDCPGWCLIYDKNNVLEFKCPVCGTVTCVRCGSIHTQGRGCKKLIETNDDDCTLENLIDRGDAMLCPGCNTVLSKQQGCDWIKCAVCFMEICWATKGPRWGPKGKGDTTGGCKCGIPPGRKCHTDCKYCH